MKISLNHNWTIKSSRIKELTGDVPLTVLSALINHHIIDNPYYRNNEELAREYLYEDYVFEAPLCMRKTRIRPRSLRFHPVSQPHQSFVRPSSRRTQPRQCFRTCRPATPQPPCRASDSTRGSVPSGSAFPSCHDCHLYTRPLSSCTLTPPSVITFRHDNKRNTESCQ